MVDTDSYVWGRDSLVESAHHLLIYVIIIILIIVVIIIIIITTIIIVITNIIVIIIVGTDSYVWGGESLVESAHHLLSHAHQV